MWQIPIVFIEVIIAYILQTAVFTDFQMAGVVPDVMIIVICAVAYMKGRIPGTITGFFCGLLVDCTYGNVIGLFAFMYATVGNFCGYANKIYDRDDYTMPFILIGLSEFVYNLLYFVFFMVLNGKLNIGWYMVKYIFPKIIYTVFVALLFYRLLNMQNNFFDKRKNRVRKIKKEIESEIINENS